MIKGFPNDTPPSCCQFRGGNESIIAGMLIFANHYFVKKKRCTAFKSQIKTLTIGSQYISRDISFRSISYPLSLSSISSISGIAEIPPRRSTHRLATALPTLPN